ncbi:MAG TPA: hypothetical protein VHM31_08985 [Polyangia bacterium]|nr:hypothetical protein [Polyangia bacterium]
MVHCGLPLLGALVWAGCHDGHGAPLGQGVTDDTVIARFDPDASVYRQITLSLGPHGAAVPGTWNFDILDVDDNRLAGVKTHWQSSDPKVVNLPAADVTTKATDVMWETELDFQAVGAGDAVVTGTVVGGKTVTGAPLSVTVNVHVTGPAAKVVVNQPFQANVLNLDPIARSQGRDTISLTAAVTDAAGEPVRGAMVDWTCAGAPSDAEFTTFKDGGGGSGGSGSIVGAGCAQTSQDFQGVRVRGYHAGLFGFHVAVDGAPEIGADAEIVFVGEGAQLELDPPALALVVGGSRQVAGTVVDADGTRYPAGALDLSSHDQAVATAVGNLVRGVASGAAAGQVQSTTMTATLGGSLSAELGVIVYRPPAMVVVSPELTLAPAGQGTVTAKLLDTDGVSVIPTAATTLSWSTDQPAVATAEASSAGDSATVTAVAVGTTQVRATTAEGASGVAQVTVQAGGSGTPGCYPECIEALRRACVPSGACTTSSTPPQPYSDTFYFCYGNGVRIVSMSTNTGSRHTQYRPDGAVCFVIDTTFSGTNGRNVSEVWQDGAGNVVGTETYDSLAADGGRTHSVTCGGQTTTIDSAAPGCDYPDCSTQDASCK